MREMVVFMVETILEQQTRRTERQEYFSSEDIVGKRVKNPDGYDLGEISSLRVGLPTGKVAYAVLRSGGMFGLGSKFFAIPIEAMIYRPGDDVFVVNISKYKLENDPGFVEGDWPREPNWNLIESTRPMGPPSQEEARAVTRVEPPPREVVTTERVEVREKAGRTGIPITAEEVEGRGTTATQSVMETRPEEVVTTELRETRERVTEETRPVTGVERPTTTPGPAPGHISASDLQTYLKGMDYPAGREDLVAHAQRNNAPESVITILQGFSNRTYRSAAEVSEEFGRETRGERPGAPETVTRGEPEVRKTVPHRERISASDLQTYLKGMDYPARKEDLIVHAQRNNAPESVIAAIRQFSDRTYQSAADVSEEFGKIA
ncbi:PRC-barrel domain-containing protein [Methanoculleus thermophilus]|uniref:PRC-barrel domain-containing protein n=2 Tax=Methanoculleus thermophilus TaxID=2200 RepID=A0A1G8Z7F2_9EURY|nr:PRC-barrel domain-containing protein [Methanoculleus thermophilus]